MPLDILHPAQRKFIYEAPMTGASVLLFDIPGGQMGRLLDSISNEGATRGEGFVRHFEQYGYAVTFVVAITNHEKSVISLGEVLDMFGDMVDYVAVKNLFFEQYPGDFALWDGGVIGGEKVGGNKKAVLLKRGGKVISMPALSQHVVAILQALHLRFEDARRDARLRLLDRSRVIQWMDRLDAQFDQAGDYLGLSYNKK
ncbi:hypothetical protein N826_25850 [Skermanella aerolata KACC 11604]|nr:hypothetical protein N826_25850 [Skermanella aerolata KACC 11604]